MGGILQATDFKANCRQFIATQAPERRRTTCGVPAKSRRSI